MSYLDNILICVDCGGDVAVSSQIRCIECGRVYIKKDGIIESLPTKMNELSALEAKYHDNFEEDALQVHQLNSLRVRSLHEYVWNKLRKFKKRSRFLEIGAGSCFDAKQLENDYELTLTDISANSLRKAKKELIKTRNYLAADGLNLPFRENGFDAVYMIAVLHHFVDPTPVIKQIERVLKSGGTFIAGIEPNYLFFSAINKNRDQLCKATHMQDKDVSQADAEMMGFKSRDFYRLFDSKYWHKPIIKANWFLSGFVHYGLEFLFRSMRLKKRIKLPLFLEKVFYFIDSMLLSLSPFKKACWHWTVVVEKK